jgi:dTDP-4-amino-4,6-dideoxygalactose transaminase
MQIPLVDLRAQYQILRPEIDPVVLGVIAQGAFIGGDEVQSFRREFAAYCADGGDGVPAHCATCGNGTDALYLALRALGVGPGDEVITVSHTFIATAEAITLTGAKPVFVDILTDTMLMDPDAIEQAVTPRTKAILAVHLNGQPCRMDRVNAIAQRNGLKVVEDAAQAHGARWEGRRAGLLADAACFSFFPGKNLGAYGDGGAVVSRNAEFIERVWMLANHGRLEKYTHQIEGVNSRLDALHAAVLRVKLRRLDDWNASRRRIAARYCEGLKDCGIGLPVVHPNAEPVWHLFVIRTPDRKRLQTHLQEQGIATGVHYPLPLHLQPAYNYLGMPEGALPVTERTAREIVSLPIYPEMTEEQVEYVIRAVREVEG